MSAPIQFVYILLSLVTTEVCSLKFTENDLAIYKSRVKEMFYHAYNKYIENAYPYDELRPLSCDGIDTWGSFSLTLIDALDTLAVMGNYTEFQRVAKLITEKSQFDININVSVFETNIRVIGGLLSAHLLSKKAGMQLEEGWPCSGPLLRLAESVARRILPAFDTPTKMPYGTVNLRHGVPPQETPITCTACVSSYIVEFGTLSRLTGDPIFEETAMNALLTLWKSKSSLNLVGNHIDVLTGGWTAVDSGIGAGIDSYFEYLVKGAILFQKPELMEMFTVYRAAIEKHMLKDDWYMWVNMQRGSVTMPLFQSLEAYWPGLLSLVGEIQTGLKSLHNYHQIWKQYGFTPEFYNIPSSEAHSNREGYPLRPELIESIMYLYRATKDPLLLQMGVDILESIQHSAKTPCGYATIKDVRDHKIEDRMESFFLAETTKYLYLLFDTDNFIHGNGSRGTVFQTTNGHCMLDVNNYIFNTEAHPIDIAAVHCCSSQKKKDDALLKQFEENIDLLGAYGLKKNAEFLKLFIRKHTRQRKVFKDVEEEKPIIQSNLPETEMNKQIKNSGERLETSIKATKSFLQINDAMENTVKFIEETLDYFKDYSQNRSMEPKSELPNVEEDVKSMSKLNTALKKISYWKGFVDEVLENNNHVLKPPKSGKVTAKLTSTPDISKINLTVETDHATASESENNKMPISNARIEDNKSENVETSKLVTGIDLESEVELAEKEKLKSAENEEERIKKWAEIKPKFKNDYSFLLCPVQPFSLRYSILGETFNVE